MPIDDRSDEFGCARCYGEDAEQTRRYYDSLAIEEYLIDDAHLIVQVRHCPSCKQQFLWIFAESVDWNHGEDAQNRNVLPLTSAEAKELKRNAQRSISPSSRRSAEIAVICGPPGPVIRRRKVSAGQPASSTSPRE